MSYADGWAALNLEMPERIPRTEYSAHSHWKLVRAVTGFDVGVESSSEMKAQASRAFVGPEGWDYDLMWSTLIGRNEFGDQRTSMGHAVYAAGGVDYDDNTFSAFSSPEEVLAFDPVDRLVSVPKNELIGRFESHYKKNAVDHPDLVSMTGVYVTCISGMIDLFGWDMLLMAAGADSAGLGDVLRRYGDWIHPYFEALADSDVPVVMVHDDIVWTAGPFIQPDWYRQYVFPNYCRHLAPLIEAGKRILFTSDGDYSCFVDDIVQAGVTGFAMEPMTDMASVAERYGQTHTIIGNADTRVLLSGEKEDIRREVERCVAIGRNCPGFMLAVGNHIPPNTPVDSALYYNDVYDELSRR